MKCRKCKQQLKQDALFCGSCGAKIISINNLANILKVTAIVDIILIGISLIAFWYWGGFLSIFIQSNIVIKIISVYIAVIIIRFNENYAKASFLKNWSVAYLLLIVVHAIIHLFILGDYPSPIANYISGDYISYRPTFSLPFYLRKAILELSVFLPYIIPILYIIFTSKMQKMYLQSKDN